VIRMQGRIITKPAEPAKGQPASVPERTTRDLKPAQPATAPRGVGYTTKG